MSSGFLLINKLAQPAGEQSKGYTSHDVVNQLRRITGIKKIGHAGTLDPFASGLLIVAVGRESTKRLGEFLKLDKEYNATLALGAVSDTYDRTGLITKTNAPGTITSADIEHVLKKFRGEIRQIPPMFSAKKINGKKLYELARKGKEVERKPVPVFIHELQLIEYNQTKQLLTIRCRVSSGTYIRALAHDIGNDLQCGAYLQELYRSQIGSYSISDSVRISELTPETWQTQLKSL